MVPGWKVPVREMFLKISWYLVDFLSNFVNLVVNNKDNTVFLSQNYRSDSCPLEIHVL